MPHKQQECTFSGVGAQQSSLLNLTQLEQLSLNLNIKLD